MHIAPLAGALGAEITGVDLKATREWDAIHKAFAEYAVLVVRDQMLQPADIMAIGEQLGSRPEVVGLRLLTKQDAYEEVVRIFAGKDDIVSLITPDVLPASWRFALEPDAAPVRQAIVRDFSPNAAVKHVSCVSGPA